MLSHSVAKEEVMEDAYFALSALCWSKGSVSQVTYVGTESRLSMKLVMMAIR